jgi:predicted GH43/DUF377 family glycosyl hydrolase
VTYAVGVAQAGESIWVAQGTYTENLAISKPLTLAGGYEAAGWTRDVRAYETVLNGAGVPIMPGDWDGRSALKPGVISDTGTFKMWYDGTGLLGEIQVGLATSDNGITWTKAATNPVLSGTVGAWDAAPGEHAPFVLKEDGVYAMWYEGRDASGVRQLGYATSTNGLDWTKPLTAPVLAAGPDGYDQQGAAHGTVLHEEGTYKLWYHAMGDQGAIIAYATSPDGVTWSKQGPSLTPQGGWDENLWGPSVLKLAGTYWMWYAGAGPVMPSIGVVTSTDGINWTRVRPGPILTSTMPIGDPHVISASGKLHMWYNNFAEGAIYYAESQDGIHWTPSRQPVVTQGQIGQWGEPVVTYDTRGNGSILDGFTITGGQGAQAGGVHGGSAEITIRRCTIRGNRADGTPENSAGGGVLGGVAGEGHVTIVDSRVVHNHVFQGASGVRVHGGGLAMTNTLVADNDGAEGIHLNGPASLFHVTIAGNGWAAQRPGINYNPIPGAWMTIRNSILYGNADVIHMPDPTTLDITYSDIEFGWPGMGNIPDMPQFVDPKAGNYHLKAMSPAIDAGHPAGAPPADLDGTTRDLRPDMGAYEFERLDYDVAVTDVEPAGAVAVNVPFDIRATLFNPGASPVANVPVTCTLLHGGGQVYQQGRVSGPLNPVAWQVLGYPAYTPTSQGVYTLTCRSAWPGDLNPANDALTKTLVVREAIADVWTKDNPNDDGSEPSGLNNWYTSPDLWVRNQDDGGLIHQDPVVAMTNTVYVRLRNRGTVPVSGTVDVYWIEPSLGVRCGDWAPIGTIPFTDLMPSEVRIVSAPWVPSRTGHTCLQDVIDSPQDPYNRALECTPQWVPYDNNVEWHNVNIIENSGPGLAGVQDIQQAEVQLVNVYNLAQDVDLILERKTFPTTGTMTVRLPAPLFDRWVASGARWHEGVEVMTSTGTVTVTGAVSATLGAIPMEAAEKATVDLTFEAAAGLTFEMAVRERIDGITVGGVAYQWTIPDTTAPTLIDRTPGPDATEVALGAPLVLTFDEPVAPLNVDLSLTPDPGGWTIAVSDAGTVVTATHAGFDAEQTYTVTVNATDAATNPLDPAVVWSFTTAPIRIYLPLTLKQ